MTIHTTVHDHNLSTVTDTTHIHSPITMYIYTSHTYTHALTYVRVNIGCGSREGVGTYILTRVQKFPIFKSTHQWRSMCAPTANTNIPLNNTHETTSPHSSVNVPPPPTPSTPTSSTSTSVVHQNAGLGTSATNLSPDHNHTLPSTLRDVGHRRLPRQSPSAGVGVHDTNIRIIRARHVEAGAGTTSTRNGVDLNLSDALYRVGWCGKPRGG